MKITKLLLSTKVTLVLLIAFAASMGVATFIENDHGTPVARGLVYDAWWFEVIMVWMAINFIAHIGQYILFHKNRWPVGLFHVAFVIIILGAGVTRYFSQEGMIHIREGEDKDMFYTMDKYLQIKDTESGEKFEKSVLLLPKNFKPKSVHSDIGGDNFQIVFEDYISGATEYFIDGEDTYVDIAVAMGAGREDYLVDKGRYIQLGSLTLSTKNDDQHPIRIFKEGDTWYIESEVHLQMMEMSSQKMGTMHVGEKQPLQLRSLYQWDEGAFLIKAIHENAKVTYVPEEDESIAKNLLDVIKYRVLDDKGNSITEAYVKMVSLSPGWSSFTHRGKTYSITYGPKQVKLPYSLYLNDFQLERYPGSQSPASYASEVMVMDGTAEFPYRIFMNNVLDYRGYRFYQASYDNDEKGTVLSVNQDRPGTYFTYLGYTLLTIGMFLTLFAKGSRFNILNKKVDSIKEKSAVQNATSKTFQPIVVASLAILLLVFSWSMIKPQDKQNDFQIPKNHADAYGQLIVQDLDGRMKPLNTLANEIVRKISGKSYIQIQENGQELRLSPEQFLLALQMDPKGFSERPIIKIDQAKSYEVFQKLNIPPTDRLSFMDLVDAEGAYIIQDLVEQANQLKPSQRNEAHNELLKTDERFNIFYGLLTGDFLRLFPNRWDANNTWFTGQQFMQGFDDEDAVFVKNITPLYLQAIQKGINDGDWEEAEETLSYIALYQKKAGEEVYPNTSSIKAELIYTQLNLGSRLFAPFWLLGAVMLVLAIWMLFKNSLRLEQFWKAGVWLAWIGFVVFSLHLSLRWYIAKHPPWSDGFEMLVFVAWGVLLFGLLFAKKSRFTVPLGLIFSGTLLFVGFLDWLNPEITNLMPVLHSYWLKIHVAVIVSGYAPLALSAIIGLLCLIFLIFKPKNVEKSWYANIRELQIVNEMSITIGLFLLTIGTFLGGVWANESWGRYWAWDPKETWALISIIVYAFILHLRLVPSLKSSLLYNLASLWAFGAIIMTSFGVNYYLSGLHSYAKGDPVPVPLWVYWAILILLIISGLALWKFNQMKNDEKRALVV
ncbi:cytochrome c biogenesis protein [Cecembia lonarensis]|uniref:Cytochrome c-type biogenesis protein CcsB n=1 Tax=Cecembia lonarensis (strain CCUG 58316 / KCTC 22772 / LW9) TaxID=1225176 RepID=K1KUU9_CECL9|nr:cytochrome c biogenesis protein CcsA [Cecembia lonarensis]EKB47965.1 cytochrome c-type biogenesis protein CcsB [Cecembia lonarensis LW9]